MSKVICDVCGTSYPDTATQCPICGYVSTAAAHGTAGSSGEGSAPASGYTYVKGGRFSKANVRKRNIASGVVSVNGVQGDRSPNRNSSANDNKGLTIIAIVLFLAIIAVVLYITFQFVLNGKGDDAVQDPTGDTTAQANVEDDQIACERINFDLDAIEFTKAGDTEKLIVTVVPGDTTDELGQLVSENPQVATVTINGNVVTVTAVGEGETQIKLTCGTATAVCNVKCVFENELILPETITLTKAGHKTDIYPDDILRTDIQWESDDENIATVKDGTVTAVSEGTTIIRAIYNDQIAECIVVCEFDGAGDDVTDNDDTNNDVINGTGNVTEDGGSGTSEQYRLTSLYSSVASDLTLYMYGDPGADIAYLKVVDSNGDKMSGATWTTDDSDVCTVEDGTVKAVGAGTAVVTASYNGETFKCVIRVY